MNAAENAVVVSTINAAVEARVLSSMKDAARRRQQAAEGPDGAPIDGQGASSLTKVHDALYASKIICYAQGLDLMRTMGEKKSWDLDLGGIAAIWRGGCIIRARFLNRITEAYRADPKLWQPDARAVLHRTCSTAASRTGATSSRWPSATASRCRRSAPRSATTTATAAERLPRQPAAGAARLLRRPHLRAHRQAGRAVVPHRLARGHRIAVPAALGLRASGAAPATPRATVTHR